MSLAFTENVYCPSARFSKLLGEVQEVNPAVCPGPTSSHSNVAPVVSVAVGLPEVSAS